MRQKKIDKKSWYSPPPLIHKLFRYQKFCETKKGSTTKFFGTVRQQIFCRKSWFSLLGIKFFETLKFWNTDGFLDETFRHCETKYFDWKLWYSPPPLIYKFFRYQKLCETKKGSPTKFFGPVRQQIFDRKSWYSLLGIKFFDTRNFLKHRRVPRRSFSALWDENFSTENRDTLLHKVQR